MAEFNVNMDAEYPEIPKGTYECIILSSEMKEGEKAPYIAVQLAIAEGEYAGKNVFDNISTSEKNQPRLAGFMRALGFEGSGLLKFDTDQLKDKLVNVTGAIKEDQLGKRWRPTSYSAHASTVKSEAAPAPTSAAPAAPGAPVAAAAAAPVAPAPAPVAKKTRVQV